MNVQSETCNFKSLLGPLESSSQVLGEMLGDSLFGFPKWIFLHPARRWLWLIIIQCILLDMHQGDMHTKFKYSNDRNYRDRQTDWYSIHTHTVPTNKHLPILSQKYISPVLQLLICYHRWPFVLGSAAIRTCNHLTLETNINTSWNDPSLLGS